MHIPFILRKPKYKSKLYKSEEFVNPEDDETPDESQALMMSGALSPNAEPVIISPVGKVPGLLSPREVNSGSPMTSPPRRRSFRKRKRTKYFDE